MKIKPPEGVDSLGKLNEWLTECGIPPQEGCAMELEDSLAPSVCVAVAPEIWWQTYGLGFKFERGNRDEANEGYRKLIDFVARSFYAHFACGAYEKVLWRVRPELSEDKVLFKLVNADGTDCHLDEDD